MRNQIANWILNHCQKRCGYLVGKETALHEADSILSLPSGLELVVDEIVRDLTFSEVIEMNKELLSEKYMFYTLSYKGGQIRRKSSKSPAD
jgi:hypothetical protein